MSVSYHFKGTVVLITGSSSGIGAATAILFAKSGADVVITGRNAQNLSDVAQKCLKVSDNKSTVLQVVADITKEEDIRRLLKSTIDKFGKLDVLVNNAAICPPSLITDPKYMDNHKTIFETNLNPVVYLTHLCIEYLAKTKGNIINISSIASVMWIQQLSSYSMSKSALDIFTKCMAVELGSKKIRVNGIIVGAVQTPLSATFFPPEGHPNSFTNVHKRKLPVGRGGQPEDIANTILFLASDAAAFMTGSNIVADGGNIAGSIRVEF